MQPSVLAGDQLNPSLQLGMRLHLNGDLAGAEQLYHQALKTSNEDPEAMLLLGVLAREQQHAEDAIAWTKRALVVRPKHEPYLLNLGLAYLAQNNLDEAELCFATVLSQETTSAIAWCRMAEVATFRNHPVQARACYKRALAADPRCWTTYLTTARWHRAQGKPDDAIQVLATAIEAFSGIAELLVEAANEAGSCNNHAHAEAWFEAAARLTPTDANIRYGWAVSLRRQGKLVQASLQFQKACELDSTNTESLRGMGLCCFELGRIDDAIRCFRTALQLLPESAQLWHDLGRTFAEVRNTDEAVPCLHRAVELEATNAVYWNTLGGAILYAHPALAEECYRNALNIQPDFPEANVNLGITLMLQGNNDEVIRCYERGLQLHPDLPGGRYNLALAYLRAGRFTEAWPLHESRWRFPELKLIQRHATTQQWRGENIAGQTILLHAEQGLGDAIQFLRYAPMVAALGANVIVEVPSTLRSLAQSLQGIQHVIVRGEAAPAHQWQCPLMSLPLAFRTTLDTIPGTTPYLHVSDGAIAAARQSFPGTGLRVGLVWAGNPSHRNDLRRSIPFENLEPLTRIPNVSLFSLQKGLSPGQFTSLTTFNITDAGTTFANFTDTAALVSTLDLVISVDTSVAHLAGALGKPVWILLPRIGDWRWLAEGDTTAWYPTARLFRQTTANNWADVIEAVAANLHRDQRERHLNE